MIIITGVAGGIGEYLANKFIENNNENIIGIYHKNIPKSLYKKNNFKLYRADLTKETDLINLIKKIKVEDLDKLKLIHCAGITKNAFIHKMPYQEWQEVLNNNLNSAFLLMKYFIPLMRAKEYGRIILISSIVPQIGVIGTSSYAASKAGLWGLMKTAVKENAIKNVTCNTLNLGYFNIGMIKDVPENMLEQIIDTIPSKSLGNPNDIYNAIDFLIKSSFVNGAQIDINGGLF